MFKKFKKRYFVIILVFSGLFLSFSYAISVVQFVADVILDLPGITLGDIYIDGDPVAGPMVDSFDISGPVFSVDGIVNGDTFTLEDSIDNIILQLTPSGGTADFSFSSTNFSDGYIDQWNITSSVSVTYTVALPAANTSFVVKINGVEHPSGPFDSGPSAEISFTQAGSGIFTVESPPCQNHNIWGYAWSENIGWISFSCENNTPIGTGVDYGVDIDDLNDRLEGYVWSENIGWITFNSFNPDELNGCPSGICEANIDVSGGTGEITGWARACVVFQSGCSGFLKPDSEIGGWDGWIKLSGTAQDATPYGPALNPVTGEFEGWAWGGDPNDDNNEAVVGYLSFNSVSGGGPNDYAVKTSLVVVPPNNLPTAVGLNVTEGNYCFASSPPIFLNWTFSDPDAGDSQSAYRIQVDNNFGFPSPEIDTGKVISGSSIYAPGLGVLSFNTTYWWRLMVWDNSDESSGWVTPPNFVTDPRWPDPSFTWDPDPPPAEWDVQFDSTVSNCPACTYLWDFGTGDTDVVPDPIYVFLATNNYDVTLRARSGGLWCETTQTVSVGAALPLPTWIEITPF